MTAHWLVHIHRVQARSIEARQPHVADDDYLERVLRVLESLGQFFASRLVADVALPVLGVGRRAGHDDLHDARRIIVAVPVWTDGRDGFIEFDADAAAHADDHRLAVHRLQADFEVPHQVFGDQLETLLRADQCLELRPLGLQLLLVFDFLAFGSLLELLVQ